MYLKRHSRTIRKPNPNFESRERFQHWDPGEDWNDISMNLFYITTTLTHLYSTFSILFVMIDFMYINDCFSRFHV